MRPVCVIVARLGLQYPLSLWSGYGFAAAPQHPTVRIEMDRPFAESTSDKQFAFLSKAHKTIFCRRARKICLPNYLAIPVNPRHVSDHALGTGPPAEKNDLIGRTRDYKFPQHPAQVRHDNLLLC